MGKWVISASCSRSSPSQSGPGAYEFGVAGLRPGRLFWKQLMSVRRHSRPGLSPLRRPAFARVTEICTRSLVLAINRLVDWAEARGGGLRQMLEDETRRSASAASPQTPPRPAAGLPASGKYQSDQPRRAGVDLGREHTEAVRNDQASAKADARSSTPPPPAPGCACAEMR